MASPSAGPGGSAELTHSKQRCKPRLSVVQKTHGALFPRMCRFHDSAFCCFCWGLERASLTQEYFQRSVIGLRAVTKSTGVPDSKQNPQSLF